MDRRLGKIVGKGFEQQQDVDPPRRRCRRPRRRCTARRSTPPRTGAAR